jgi:predicted DNA binding protein
MQLAERFHISRTTVMAHLDRHHVQRRSVAKHWDDDALAAAADAYTEGASLAAIAKPHDLDPQTVANRLRRAGIKIRPRRGWK